MQVNKKIDIHLVLGNPTNLQFLLDLNTSLTSNPEKINQYLSQSEYKAQIGQNIVLVFRFDIEEGKEKEALAYVQQALECDRNNRQHLSPLQKYLLKPEVQGKVQHQFSQGKIIIKYTFFVDKIESFQYVYETQQVFAQFQKFSVDTQLQLKGNMKHNSKNRTNVKVDYVDFRIASDEISPSDYKKLTQVFGINQDQFNFLCQIPVFNMLGNLKRANFEMKLASFRQLKSYFHKASGNNYNKQEKPFPYVNQGIFRKQADFYFFYKNKLSFKAEANYNGEDAFMRLIKVYQVAFQKLTN